MLTSVLSVAKSRLSTTRCTLRASGSAAHCTHWAVVCRTLSFRSCPESECAQQMKHTPWSYSGFPSLGVDTQVSSVHRLRCKPDRNHVRLHDRQSPLVGCQLMRDPKEEHPEGITQRPCGLREANIMTMDTVTSLPAVQGVLRLDTATSIVGTPDLQTPGTDPALLFLSHPALLHQRTLRPQHPKFTII